MNDGVHEGHHPPQDMLADLAAEALPLDQARELEAHVMTCPHCERLLADAERVRALFSYPDPGPMPDDVWARVETSLTTETGQRTSPHPTHHVASATSGSDGQGWFDTPVPPNTISVIPDQPPAPAASPAPAPAFSPPPPMSFDEAPTAAWKAFLDDPPPEEQPEPAIQRASRTVRSMRSRRDVRAEDEDTSSRWARPTFLAGAAAAGLSVLGLGGWAAMTFLGEGSTDSAVQSLPAPSAHSVMYASGAEYTASTLADQAMSLVKTGSPVSAVKPSAGKGSAVPAVSLNAAIPSKPGTISDPQQLTSCLRALGGGDRQPRAVDFARYEGREAAVIVLRGEVSGFDVWVVARDCRPGAEGHLGFKAIPG